MRQAEIVEQSWKPDAWCGLRWGEVSELRCKDLDLKAMTVRVERAQRSAHGRHAQVPRRRPDDRPPAEVFVPRSVVTSQNTRCPARTVSCSPARREPATST
jgi:integrase